MNDVESEGDVASGGHGGGRSNAFLCSKLERAAVGARADAPLPRIPDPLPVLPCDPCVPSAPAGIDPQLFARAKAALDSHQVAARDYMGIVDFSKASNEQRFHVVDLRSGLATAFVSPTAVARTPITRAS